MNGNITAVVLDNGLQVILKEVHSSPLISSWLWYRVGSRNEVEGSTGLSHWVEHMLFKGSKQFPKGSIMRLVDRYGGETNAMTSQDFTAYYETLPSTQVDLALQIEADRMSNALFELEEVESERTVIIAEREESENEPVYVLQENLAATAFQVHPYHHQIVGWKADIEHITRDELVAHYQHYYTPDNAVLIIVGDLQPAELMKRIEGLFGSIKPGSTVSNRISPEPPQRGERRVVVRLPGSTPIIQIAYHTPAVAHPDYLPLLILNGVLSGGSAPFNGSGMLARSARLYLALVETQLASSVGSYYHVSLDPTLFNIYAVVRQGRRSDEVERALFEQIERLQQEQVSADELRVAIRQTQAQLAYANESAARQALALGMLTIVDRYTRLDGFLDELATVTPNDVLRVAQSYLSADNRIVGWFEPLPGGAL
ncbi:MAG: insulinase family protein [Chloroflexi bacterium]|nr:insulinase family protein [Chloroflexota bacterium]